jgi:hypothetical protein
VKRRSPTNSSVRSIQRGGSPHPGQASSWAATAGVKRSRQLGQQPWVMTDPFIRSPKGQCSPPPVGATWPGLLAASRALSSACAPPAGALALAATRTRGAASAEAPGSISGAFR